ncbi:MAG: tRNA (guanine-N1)-methyltransferase [Halothece sp.]
MKSRESILLSTSDRDGHTTETNWNDYKSSLCGGYFFDYCFESCLVVISTYQEGKAHFQVRNAFYRPTTQVVRDLGILAARIHRQKTGELRVLDAMAGCGVRGLRYVLEAEADFVWVNEADPNIHPVLSDNLRANLSTSQYKLTQIDANRIFFDGYNRSDFYDLIDVDCFGAPIPYLGTVLWGTKLGGMVYLTSTDGRSVTGNNVHNSLKFYGAYGRSHPAAHEQGLRMIMGRLQQQAASQGRGVQPVFAYFTGETYRVMMRFVENPELTEENYGWLGYCHHCGDYQRVSWRKLGKATCPHDGEQLVVTGPMWLDSLHDRATVQAMADLATKWGWNKRASLLTMMATEADLPPYFYTLQHLGKKGKMDLPKRDRLITTLQEEGYRACTTHVNLQAIKTDASFTHCVETAKRLTH